MDAEIDVEALLFGFPDIGHLRRRCRRRRRYGPEIGGLYQTSPTNVSIAFGSSGDVLELITLLLESKVNRQMSASLTVISGGLPAALGPELAAAVDLAKAEKAASTRKAYGTDFRIFRTWCEARGVSALPAAPETVAAYLAANAGTSKSTLGRRIAAIRYAHKLAGLPLPTDAEGVKATMRRIRRTHGSARLRKAPAVSSKMLGMVATAPENLAGLRDRAMLLIGFGGALRRSELIVAGC